jgi:hypothetical protein
LIDGGLFSLTMLINVLKLNFENLPFGSVLLIYWVNMDSLSNLEKINVNQELTDFATDKLQWDYKDQLDDITLQLFCGENDPNIVGIIALYKLDKMPTNIIDLDKLNSYPHVKVDILAESR